jgi:endonuclease/exonuclease/phosphatase family metal-dependent hydrolase
MSVALVMVVLGLLLLGVLLWSGGGKTIQAAQCSGIIEAIPDAWEQSPVPVESLVVLSYNLGYGFGEQWQAQPFAIGALCDRLDQIAETIAASGADVALLQEVDFASQRTHYIDQLHYIAAALGWGFAARAITWECRYLPYPLWPLGRQAGRLRAGMGVISRYPLVQNMRQRLSQASALPGLARLFWPYHTVQMVDVQCGSRTLRLLHVHLGAERVAARQQQARELVDFVRQVETPTTVLMGAFCAADSGEVAASMGGERSAEQTVDIVTAALRGRFRVAPAVAVHTYAQQLLIGSGLQASEIRVVSLATPVPRQLPLVVRLHWALPLVTINGSSTHECF